MKRSTLLLLLLFNPPLRADEEKKPKSRVSLSGFVKHESYWDTRQVVGSADDENLRFPEPKKLDANCCDINAKGQFDMSDIASRLKAAIDGPEIKHAKIDGVIEGDFVGKSGIINIVRMRLAYLTLTWGKTVLLGGQDYMPMYVKKCNPNTLSRNKGRPMEAYSRNPQFKVIYKPTDSVHLNFAMLSQLDFLSDGPIGNSSTYLRDAVVPLLQARFDIYCGEHIFGAGLGYKRLVPRLETDTGAKARESINSAVAIAYAAFNWESFKLRNKLIFAQNGSDMSLLGGYAVTFVDPINDNRDYTNINAIAWWMDFDVTKHETFMPGMFLGVIKNLGARTCILTDQPIFGLGTDIDYVLRVSPRFRWTTSKFEFGAELEYTRAAYGTINDTADVINTDPVANTRLMVTMYYYF